jgi:hypothetical protein
MKAEDLRVGNYLDYHGTTIHVMSITKRYCDFGYFQDSIGFMREFDRDDFPNPVPLTEEWLLKFGFALCPACKDFERLKMPYYAKEGVLLFFNEHRTTYELSDYYIGFGEMRGGEYSAVAFRWIEYVHQLQNLYFALTGEELTIK